MKLKIISTAHHRNGVAGDPFDVVLFNERGCRKVAILFEGSYQCAVLEVSRLAAGDIAFGSNSWRGDEYEPQLRAAIAWSNAETTKADDIKDQPTTERNNP